MRLEIEGQVAAFGARLAREALECHPEGAQAFRVRWNEPDGDRLFALAAESGAVLCALTPLRSSLEQVFMGELARAERE
jgi:hypothetical protein